MYADLNAIAAEQHRHDLLVEAEHARLVAAVRRPGRRHRARPSPRSEV